MRASWELLHACNYRCAYCPFIPSWRDDAERTNNLHKAVSAADWLAFWERMAERRGPFEIDVSGGEPTLYPGFFELAARVGKLHRLRILTNLSWEPSRAGALDAKTRFLASFHPGFSRLDAFLAAAAELRARGFEVAATFVAHPDSFAMIEELDAAFARAGLLFLPAPFQGEHAGRSYPAAYDAEQRAALRRRRGGRDPLFSLGLAEEVPSGRLCGAGATYLRAYPDGALHRCVAVKDVLGSILDPAFDLADAPAPCPAALCLCPAEYRELEAAAR